MVYRSRVRTTRHRSSPIFIVVALLLALIGGVGYSIFRVFLAPKPKIALAAPFDLVGRNAPLLLDVKEPKYGLRHVKVTVRQPAGEHVIFEERYNPPRPEVQVKWLPVQAKGFRLAEGEGQLKVEARSAKWAGVYKGKLGDWEHTFKARLQPPRIEMLTTQHYVNHGGCDMVVYRVTPAGAESGVVVGRHFFKGFPLPGAKDPSTHFALFALPYDVTVATPVRLRARDEASNEVISTFALKVFPKKFRASTLDLDEAFLNKVVPEILSQSPSLTDQGDLLKNYLSINRDLRRTNNQRLADLASRSRREMLWKGPFLRPLDAAVEAFFADHRTYRHQGQVVDTQDHLGYDLAHLMNAPVKASNTGEVVLAEFFGIYGNTIVIDHGFGLLTLYGHLNSFGVQVGDRVEKGQVIGQTGATGLAAGDHLHFSVVFQSTQVDAKEWWDPHWVHDRIEAKLQQFAPSAEPSPSPRPASGGKRKAS